ncbi:MAG TPA: YceD family protein [Steroidobacteraceae bacterium]|nr:YceD family protein [Steroidobacteraceae bacterium]
MARGLPDIVDCGRLALEGVTLDRVYALADLPRMRDLLFAADGTVRARFAFAKTESGRAGATVAVQTVAQLVCQRCLLGFAYPLAARSEIEFTSDPGAVPFCGQREPHLLNDGTASLVELAEEELLLALPFAASCAAPRRCGQAPARSVEAQDMPASAETVRPFGALRELMKRTDRI